MKKKRREKATACYKLQTAAKAYLKGNRIPERGVYC